MTNLASARDILREVAEIVRPPERLTVPEAATQYVHLDIPGGYYGPWRNELTHYLVEPAECLTSREFEAVFFVAPAQSAKTQALIDNWIAYTVVCAPADMAVIQTARDTARDYSRRRVDRMIQASPEMRARLRPGQGDNTHDKTFRSGMILSLAWPSKNQLAGRPIGRIALTDYDRMPEDIGTEGSAFDLARQRTKTFMSRAMIVVESSPSRPIIDPKWRPKTPHEAPPTKGILGLYNTGDRRRLYGQCPSCKDWFAPEPGIEAMRVPDIGTIEERAEEAALICTACGGLIEQAHERAFKHSAIWLREGQMIDGEGRISGEGRKSRRASFWMPGWFAAFQSWSEIVAAYLSALEGYERTRDEEPLKAVVNTDMAAPYLCKAQAEDTRDGGYLEERAKALAAAGGAWERYHIPDGVRCILAAVDVQKKSFEVAAIGYGEAGQKWLIDRFAIRDVDPAARLEDWEQIVDRAVNATYKLADGRELRTHAVAVDSGGKAGVTERAYEWYRRVKRRGLGRRVRLVKGASKKDAMRVRETHPDATQRSDRQSGGRGDVPVLIINTHQLKDAVYADLQREVPGPGYTQFSDWTPKSVYSELTAELRDDKGWHKIPGRKNEAFDLFVYPAALWLYLKGDKIRWDSPPLWAAEMDRNINVMSRDERRVMKKETPKPVTRPVRFRF